MEFPAQLSSSYVPSVRSESDAEQLKMLQKIAFRIGVVCYIVLPILDILSIALGIITSARYDSLPSYLPIIQSSIVVIRICVHQITRWIRKTRSIDVNWTSFRRRLSPATPYA